MMKVSIICTNYNKGNWLSEALDSFLEQQTEFPYEIIVVDDASTDQSPDLIRAYQANYPDQIRAFFNETNQGIAGTWKMICQEARGQYIARCDGDDFWTDCHKLQKQVDLLDQHPSAKWSNTDFDLMDQDGQVYMTNVLQNKVLPFMDSYEKMLALKGMTMSSTWLVERQLMLEVNEHLDDKATDDTFDLQLELFQRTNLAFLPESTTIYRVLEESDSRTRSSEQFEKRLSGIYETQCRYLTKYEQADLREVVRLQAEQDIQQELSVFHAKQVIRELEEERAGLQAEQERLMTEVESQKQAYQDLVDQYGQLLHQYNSTITSRRWTIPTRIINALTFKK